MAMAQRDDKKRLGKKHRTAATRPKKGRAPKSTPTTGAVDPRKRKVLSTKKAEANKLSKRPTRSPENESRKTIRTDAPGAKKTGSSKAGGARRPLGRAGVKAAGKKTAAPRPKDGIVGRQTPTSENMAGRGERLGDEEQEWREMELLASQMVTETDSVDSRLLPLIAVCGRPNVGKSTLFNRLTGSRRSIVGDEPGITRDRIYGEIEWQGKDARIVDTGGVVPDDEALIPSEIFRQAQVALEEADAIVMVVDGRTELASPDMELARLLLRGGKPIFLAVNKMDTDAMQVQAENFRRLGFRNVLPISAEHGTGIGDLLDEVFAVLPEPREVEAPEVMLTEIDEAEEDQDGPDFSPPVGATLGEAKPVRRLRSHGEYEQRETKVAIIGRPNVGKSTLLNALTGTDRAIVSPIAGTTRDAVDEVVERGGHSFRFVDTAGIRRKGKTKLMAEKLSVIMARKHLEAADVSLLIIDATEGVAALDANIGGYAHESGRSVVIVINKWDLMTKVGADGLRVFDGKPPADQKVYEQQVRDNLKYLDYAPLLFISASEGKNIESVFKKVELVSRERRKRVTTGQMNKFLEKVDFQKASVPMNRRVRIYYMTQAAVAPPTFVLFTDKDIKMHFSFERFLGNQIREHFGFIGSPIWFKIKARNKRKKEA